MEILSTAKRVTFKIFCDDGNYIRYSANNWSKVAVFGIGEHPLDGDKCIYLERKFQDYMERKIKSEDGVLSPQWKEAK